MKLFTKQIKKEWLEALKSGKYIQLFNDFANSARNEYCCIAVLDEVVKDRNLTCWNVLRSINEEISNKLICINDDKDYIATGKRDYSNVIPIIEQLETVD